MYLEIRKGANWVSLSIKRLFLSRNSLRLLLLALLQCSFHFFFFVSFYNITSLDVIVVLDGQSAFHTYQYFLHIIFEALQRAQFSTCRGIWIHHDTIPDHSHLIITPDLTIDHYTTGNGCLIEFEYLADLHVGNDLFLDLGFQHSFHGTLDLVNGRVDNGIGLDLDTCILCDPVGLHGWTHVKSND